MNQYERRYVSFGAHYDRVLLLHCEIMTVLLVESSDENATVSHAQHVIYEAQILIIMFYIERAIDASYFPYLY